MRSLSKAIPIKLKKDAIAEAICEIRFHSPESETLPEVVVGRLTGHGRWKGNPALRFPAADIPPQLRQQDASLRYQPVIQVGRENRLVKIGANSLSYHVLAPYPGWGELQVDMHSAVDAVFHELPEVTVTRLGFRYLNLLNAHDHNVNSADELDFSFSLEGAPFVGPLNLNYFTDYGPHHRALTRVASPEFVAGVPTPFTVLIDVDIATPEPFQTKEPAIAKKWLDDAHGFEKKEFFALFPQTKIDKMKEV